MNSLYAEALNGTLVSQPTSNYFTVNFANNIGVEFDVFSVSTNGELDYLFSVPGNNVSSYVETATGNCYVFMTSMTGAFIAAAQLPATPDHGQWTLTVDSQMLTDPNDIGPLPVPSADVLIPVNSPNVLISSGVLPTGNIVTREQYWRRLADSYSLAAGETKTVSYSVTSGLDKTSSTVDQVSQSVGVTASGGWGPISASVSASLSQNATTMQQVSVHEETSMFCSQTLDNSAGTNAIVILRWQLMDVYNIFSPVSSSNSSQLLASFTSGQSPAICANSYNPSDPAPAPQLRSRNQAFVMGKLFHK